MSIPELRITDTLHHHFLCGCPYRSLSLSLAFYPGAKNSVFHEPLGEPFYYGPERMSNRFNAENRPEDFKKYKDLTFKKVRTILCHDYSPGQLQMAKFHDVQSYQMWQEIVGQNTEGKPRTFVKDVSESV